MRRLVLGFDGSESSHRALQWALDEAKLRGSPLVIVDVVDVTSDRQDPAPRAQWRDPRNGLDRALELAADKEIPALGILEYGSFADVLVQASRDAELLVLGESVGDGWTDESACAVVIVPAPPAAPPAPAEDRELLPSGRSAA